MASRISCSGRQRMLVGSFALAAVPEAQSAVKQDKVVFIFNFFDELRRLAPGK